jgi:hypothetical protein
VALRLAGHAVGWPRAGQHRQEEARAFKHDRIGPGHVLVGLLREREGLAARVLDSLDVTLESARDRFAHGGADEEAATGMLPRTPEVQKIYELALRAESTGHPARVGTEHILLGLVGADEAALLDFGIEADRVRDEVHRTLAALPADESSTGDLLRLDGLWGTGHAAGKLWSGAVVSVAWAMAELCMGDDPAPVVVCRRRLLRAGRGHR